MKKNYQEISVHDLKKLIDKDESLLILDVRARDRFESGHVEGKGHARIMNFPYPEMLEEGKGGDSKTALETYANKHILPVLTQEKPFVVICNRGISSGYVSETLASLGYRPLSVEGGMGAWGSLFETKKFEEAKDCEIYQINRVSRGCLGYLIASEGKAVIIDPARDLTPYRQLLKEKSLSLALVIDTHAHADHISGGKALAAEFNAPYYLHPYDGIHPMDMLPAAFSYSPLWEESKFTFGKAELAAIHIPGHTLGNSALLLNGKYLFAGDSLFINSVSRPDLGGQAEKWTTLHYHSLVKLLKHPDDLVVFPAHYSSPTEESADGIVQKRLGDLKKTNAGVQMAQKPLEEFRQYILQKLPVFPKEYIEIKKVNLGLKQVSEAEASELELGKNICAIKSSTLPH